MKAFEWANAGSYAEAVKLLQAPDKVDPDEMPRPMGGGQDLLTTIKSYITTPPRVVNLKTIAPGGKIEIKPDGSVSISALTTLTQLALDQQIGAKFPGLVEAALSIATPQIRNVGTVGGNLCQRPRCWYFRLENVKCLKRGGDTCHAIDGENKYHAIFGTAAPCVMVHPSDLSPMLMALGAGVSITGPNGVRSVPLDVFFVMPAPGTVRTENVLTPGEVIDEIHFPAPAGKSSYIKFKERASLDFAMASVAAVLDLADDHTVRRASLVLGGVAPVPWRLGDVEQFLTGKKLDEPTALKAAELAVQSAKPLSQNGYKVPLTTALVKRSLMKLLG